MSTSQTLHISKYERMSGTPQQQDTERWPMRDWAEEHPDAISFSIADGGSFAFLSNMFCVETPLSFGSLAFGSVEALFQARKFEGRPDSEDVMRMFVDKTPKQAKRLGGPRGGLPRLTAEEVTEWTSGGRRVAVMQEALRLKFQDLDLRRLLLDTGDRALVERITAGRGGDSFWGTSKAKGRGCNVLGCMLMELRKDITQMQS